mgnify:CR=1 FL=1
MELVRHTDTSPTDEDFASAIGTPLVIDTSNGLTYVKKDNAAIALVGGAVVAGSVQAQTGFSSDTYVAGSSIPIPSISMTAGMWWRWQLVIVKTAAGTAQPAWSVRIGANQSTADTARLSISTAAQTAAVDLALVTILVNCYSVGASGVLKGAVWIQHNLAATGFANTPAGFNLVGGTSAGFDNRSLGGSYIGLSINAGASADWSISQVLAEGRG